MRCAGLRPIWALRNVGLETFSINSIIVDWHVLDDEITMLVLLLNFSKKLARAGRTNAM